MNDKEFAESIMGLRSRLLNVAIKRTKNRSDAEEVVDLSIERMWRYRKGFKGNSTVYTWAYRILSNEINRMFKNNKMHRRKINYENLEFLLESSNREHRELLEEVNDNMQDLADPETQLSAMYSFAEGMKGFISLPEKSKEVLFMYETLGMTYQEIADSLAWPIGTVRSRLSRAREKVYALKKKLDRKK